MTLRALHGDGVDIYPTLPTDAYTLIVSDGAYGIGGFPGDPKSPKVLAEWYAPHLAAWDRLAAPSSSLYFWCTPEGCARMLPHVEAAGWRYYSRIAWHKGMAALAGRLDTEAMRGWATASEDCYFYVRESVDISALAAAEVTGDLDGLTHRSVLEASGADPRNTVRKFIVDEWRHRAGLTVRDIVAAWNTSADHYMRPSQWQMPPLAAFLAMSAYAEEHRPRAAGSRPYFVTVAVWERYTADFVIPPTKAEEPQALRESYEALREEYEALRYPFSLPQGVTDVWRGLPVSRPGRHSCAKRDDHTERIVTASSRPGDLVLEPFGGGAPVLRACRKLGRSCDSIERDPEWHARALASIDTASACAISDPRALPGQGGLFGGGS